VPRFADEAFRAGLARRASLLRDPTDPRDEGHPSHWVVGGPATGIDVLLIVAGSAERAVTERASELRRAAEAHGLFLVWSEMGARLGRRRVDASEHFGFRDDIAQPAVRGFANRPRVPLAARLVRNGATPDGPELAAPGTPLIWPGSFVFGYPAQNPVDARLPGRMVSAGPSWARDGSLLVFRRLRQDVVRFAEFVAVTARELGMDPEAFAALLVGRWRSGAPVVRTSPPGMNPPGVDDPQLGSDPDANNDFDFTNVLPEPEFADGHTAKRYEKARVDPLGLVCPNSAHIRKVNPRAGYTEQGGLEDTLTRRLLRRGIPYGPRLVDPLAADDYERRQDRGLHFLCYQTSIVDQFEFVTRHWLNSPAAPRGGGVDVLVGQGHRSCYLPSLSGVPVTVSTSERFVIPTGGEYLFVPSVDGLRELTAPG